MGCTGATVVSVLMWLRSDNAKYDIIRRMRLMESHVLPSYRKGQ